MSDRIDPGVRIGHVHLRTADIDRVRAFYVGVLGFDVVAEERDVPGWGTTGDILFLSAGGYHHHLGFNTWKSKGGGPQPDGVAGLTHEAIYITDPDGNDVELMWDRPAAQWPLDFEGHLVGQFGDELNLDELKTELH